MKNVTPDGPLIRGWPLRGQKRAKPEGDGGAAKAEACAKQKGGNEDFYVQTYKKKATLTPAPHFVQNVLGEAGRGEERPKSLVCRLKGEGRVRIERATPCSPVVLLL